MGDVKPPDDEGRVDGWANWEIEKTPVPRLKFLRRLLPIDRFEKWSKTLGRYHGDPSL
jgi:hypothetical protein